MPGFFILQNNKLIKRFVIYKFIIFLRNIFFEVNMKILTYLISLVIILQSSYLFAQLDSVWYQGPSTGSVTSGAIQTTDIFTDEMPLFGGEFQIMPPLESGGDKYGDMIFDWDESGQVSGLVLNQNGRDSRAAKME